VLLLFTRSSAKTAFYCSLALFLVVAPVTGAYISSLHLPSNIDTLLPILHYLKSGSLLDVFYFQLKGTYNFEVTAIGYVVIVHMLMLALFLLGFAAQKIKFFDDLQHNKKYIKRIFWTTFILTIVLNVFFAVVQKLHWQIFKYYQPRFILVAITMLFIVSSFCWLFVANKAKRFFGVLKAMGRMTLTNYIVQNIAGFLLFSGFGFGLSLSNRIHFGYYLLFALILYVCQVYMSRGWLSQYNYGPVEWIWRQLSYGKRLPIRKRLSKFDGSVVIMPETPSAIMAN